VKVYVAVVSTYPAGVAPEHVAVEQLTSLMLVVQPQNVRELTATPDNPCPEASASAAEFIELIAPAFPRSNEPNWTPARAAFATTTPA
jgi:hypothetical protein